MTSEDRTFKQYGGRSDRGLRSDFGEVVYSAESRLRQPTVLIRQMWQDLLNSRELAWRLTVRDISTQYRQSFFGVIWAFIPPIFTVAGLTIATRTNIINFGETDLPYPLYVLLSTMLWRIFSGSLNSPIQALGEAKVILTRIKFPPEAVLLSKIGQLLFTFLIDLVLVSILAIWLQFIPSWTLILLPVGIVSLCILGMAIGMLIAPLACLYQDISNGLALIMRVWFFVTPVIYPVPDEGPLRLLTTINPVTPLLVTSRELATTGQLSMSLPFWIVSALSGCVLILAWLLFRLSIPFVVERTSA